jgi:phenylacetate-coenzyme A ligase PaaK-like adenylate-forming protein
LYAALFSSLLFPAWETHVRERPTLTRLDYLDRTQWRSFDELSAIQTGALRRLARHAFDHVPFYRRRFEAAGFSPEAIRSADDLLALPVLTREEARRSALERKSVVPPFPSIQKTTGGTTGEPLVFGYEPDSEFWRNAVKFRAYAWAGYRPGQTALHYWGFPTTNPLPPLARAKIRVGRLLRREVFVNCTLRGPEQLLEVVRLVRRVRPTHLVCYTQAGADLARFVLERGLRDWDPIRVICGAERLFEHDRAAIEAAFGPATETYGCREVMLIASECGARDGLHEAMENVLVEILVTEGGVRRRARPGELGEVVLTDLHNFSMPFIRYANGDLAVAGREERCACGRGLRRLASVEGRSAETLRDASGAKVSGMVFNLIFSPLASRVRQFQAVQHADGSITLKVIPSSTLDDGIRRHIETNCQKFLRGVKVTLTPVGEIPASPSGKRQPVIVER